MVVPKLLVGCVTLNFGERGPEIRAVALTTAMNQVLYQYGHLGYWLGVNSADDLPLRYDSRMLNAVLSLVQDDRRFEAGALGARRIKNLELRDRQMARQRRLGLHLAVLSLEVGPKSPLNLDN